MARANSSPTLEVFQNISCYCLTQFHVGRRDSDTISKHLMLLFNLFVRVWSFVFSVISKHLMLLFNMFRHKVNQNLRKFQNISCYCLTIMQLFIFSKIIIFQNISCYCLTGSMIAVAIGLLYFKTSHVIV